MYTVRMTPFDRKTDSEPLTLLLLAGQGNGGTLLLDLLADL